MNYNLTKEEFDLLSPAKQHFEDAVKRNMKHSTPRWLDERVRMVYERIAGPQLINMNCGQCVFNLYQNCGRLYLKDKIAREVEEKKIQEQLLEQQRLEEEQLLEQQRLEQEKLKQENSITEPVENEDTNATVEAPADENVSQPESTVTTPADEEQSPLATGSIIEDTSEADSGSTTDEEIEDVPTSMDVKGTKPEPKKRGRKPKNKSAVAKK